MIILIFMCCVLLSMDHVLYRVHHLSVDQHDYKIYLTIIRRSKKGTFILLRIEYCCRLLIFLFWNWCEKLLPSECLTFIKSIKSAYQPIQFKKLLHDHTYTKLYCMSCKSLKHLLSTTYQEEPTYSFTK